MTQGLIELHRVQKCINFGARIVKNKRKLDHISKDVADLKWPNINQLVKICDANVTYKSLYCDPAPQRIRSCFVLRADVSSRATRATTNNKLELPRARGELRRQSFPCRTVSCWNSLPAWVTESVSVQTFRKNVKKFHGLSREDDEGSDRRHQSN